MYIVIGGQKGGTGKTTIATMRVMEGRDVYLYDLDPQRSALIWSSRRDEDKSLPIVNSGQMVLDKRTINVGAVIEDELQRLQKEYQDIIVDAGGTDNEELRAALLLADLVIFPIAPSTVDTDTLPTLDELVSGAKNCTGALKAKVLLNRVNTNPVTAKKGIEECDDLLSNFKYLSRFSDFLSERIAVQYVFKKGMAVVEYEPNGSKSSDEFKFVYEEIFDV